MDIISLRIFLFCLIACAAMVIVGIWFSKALAFPPAYFQTVATLFVIGLASFLVWFSRTLLAIRDSLRGR